MEEEEDINQQGGFPPSDFLPSAAVPLASKNASKRDEWSEGGVLSLLDAYESKWLLRNRAKLKGSDWEDIARQVKPPKAPNQCKNKIESMKKRYRAESGASGPSSWQFYSRMDNLLRGSLGAAGNCYDGGVEPVLTDLGLQEPLKVELDELEHPMRQLVPNILGDAEDSEIGLQGSDHDDGSNTIVSTDRKEGDSDTSTPESNSDTSTPKSKVANDEGALFKRRRGSSDDVAASIRLLAGSILKIEKARMEIYRDTERLRLEAEVKRAEMELKRTEILSQTQLQIAKLLSRRKHGKKSKSGGSCCSLKPAADALDGDQMKGD